MQTMEVPVNPQMVSLHERLMSIIFEMVYSQGFLPICKKNYVEEFSKVYCTWQKSIVQDVKETEIFNLLRDRYKLFVRNTTKDQLKEIGKILIKDSFISLKYKQKDNSLHNLFFTKLRRAQRIGFEMGSIASLRCMGFNAESDFLRSSFDTFFFDNVFTFSLSDFEVLKTMEINHHELLESMLLNIFFNIEDTLCSDFFIGLNGIDDVIEKLENPSEEVVSKFCNILVSRIFHNAVSFGSFIQYVRSNVKFVFWVATEKGKDKITNRKNSKAGYTLLGSKFPSGSMFPGEFQYDFDSFLLPDLVNQGEDVCPWFG